MGFFFKEQKHTISVKEAKLDELTELAYSEQCTMCSLEDKTHKHPKLEATGSLNPEVYILTGTLTQQEDWDGKHLSGEVGQLVKDQLNKYFRDVKVRYNSCTRCKTPGEREPTDLELSCCRKSLEKDIEESKPKIIIGLGLIPLKWFLKTNEDIFDWRGRRVPVKIGTHTCYFFPMFHPDFIYEKIEKQKKKGFKSKDQWEEVFEKDFKNASTFLLDDRTPFNIVSHPPRVIDSGYQDGIHYVFGDKPSDLEVVNEWLEKLKRLPKTAIDIEATRLRPYYKKSKIWSIAIGTDKEVFAFPVEHPDAWGGKYDDILALVKDFLLGSGTKIVQNLKFEQEWFLHYFGPAVLRKTKWADTMGQAYTLDERCSKKKDNMLSLNTLTLLHFGFRLKNLSKVDRSDITKSSLKDLLIYNAMDSKYEYMLHEVQDELIRKTSPSLIKSYEHGIATCATIAKTQAKGIPVDTTRLQEFSTELGTQIIDIEKKIFELPEVKKFKAQTGNDFNQDSNKDLTTVFRDILKLPSVKNTSGGKNGEKGYSTDKEVLDIFAEKGVKLAEYIKENRELSKLKSTYVDSLPDLITDDGIMHPEFNHLFTSTGRLSSENPNMQNFPKRKNKWVRAIISAPKGYWIVSVDYGQIEARVLAMASKDPVFCKAIREDYDVHKEWAMNIVKLYPQAVGAKSYEEWIKDKDKVKEYRNIIKNKLVFPLFYGSSKHSVASSLNLPDHVATKIYNEFWVMFKGVKQWQEDLQDFYHKNGYVETLSGRRRRAPLSHNEIINCVDKETEIFTSDGWKKYFEISEGTTILTKNPKDGFLEWHPIEKLNIFPDYEGELVELNYKSLSALVTKNHRWLVNRDYYRYEKKWSLTKFVETKDLSEHGDDKIHVTGKYKGALNSTWSNDEVELIGWVLTDGHFVKGQKRRNGKDIGESSQIQIIQSERANKHKVKEIDNLFKRLQVKYSRRKENFFSIHWAFSGDLGNKIRKTFLNRTLNMQFLLELTESQLNLLYITMMKGDGTTHLKWGESFCTSDKEKADIFSCLVFLTGRTCTLKYEEFKQYPSNLKLYPSMGNIPKGKGHWTVTIRRRCFVQTGWGKTSTKYSTQLVWCPTVQNETFVARRRGTIYITGNSPIQGTASDIVVDAMNRLSVLSDDLNKPELQAMINVHDDLTFLIPDGILETDIEFIAKQMCNSPFKFINVPLSIEVAIGRNWADMEDMVKFKTTDF